MQISELHRRKRLVISFELFPPKNPEAEVKLFDETLPRLMQLAPDFMTCTYGAGGSTRDKTLEIVTRLKQEVGTEAASHLTCVGASRDEVRHYLEHALGAGITNIVALRGDPPKGDTSFRPHPDGFQLAAELIPFVKQAGPFDVVAAGYPEGHPECPDRKIDWMRCVAKVEAGADAIITQLFYDNNDFFEFREFLRGHGVTVPIVPGVLPILSGQQIKRFCGMCGSKLPPQIVERLDSFGDDHDASRQYGIDLATEMCDELIRGGVPGIHFYTLNRCDSTRQVLRNLKLVPTAEVAS